MTSAPDPPQPPADRDRELAALARIQAEFGDVDRALERIDAGAYGTCEVCGEALPDEVLAREPAARLCREHRGAAAGG